MPVKGYGKHQGDTVSRYTPGWKPPLDQLMTRGRQEQCGNTLPPRPPKSPSADPGEGRGGIIRQEWIDRAEFSWQSVEEPELTQTELGDPALTLFGLG